MRDGSCFWRAAAVGPLLLGLSQSRATAQDHYQPPVLPSNDGYGEVTSTSYNAMMAELERRLVALEDKEKGEEAAQACQEIDIIKKPTHKFRGRMFFDQIWMDDLTGAVPQTLENVTGFDTIRLGVTGNIYENMQYTAEFEFEGNEVDFKDVYARVTHLPGAGHFQIGHFMEPFGLEKLTSSRFVTFMERSAPTAAFTSDRNLGFMLYNYMGDRENWSWYAGLFRGSSQDDDEDVDEDSNDWSVTGRIAGLPYYDEATPGRCLLHLGVAASARRTGDGGGVVGDGVWRGSLEMDSRVSLIDITLGNPPVGRPATSAEFAVLGLEGAYVRGPFSLQGEYFYASTGDTVGINASGAYGQVSYFLTGENRGYKKSSKAFDRVKPYEPFFLVNTADGVVGGRGAWELAFRWSWTDLESVPALLGGTVPPTVIGTQENLALGLNWYLNPYSRMMFNYVHSITDYTFIGKSEGDHFGIRFQIDW
jgi:phosphate-selective porin OprO/OprP